MTDGEIEEASRARLIQTVKDRQKYAFLIGAGSSRPEPAEILTSSELIEDWQRECYEVENPDQRLEEWIATEEQEMNENQSEYGFWFGKCHPTRGGRRERIAELVDGATPTLGHIILASMMEKEYVPHVLTPNFDDLLFDAFYRYLDRRPNLVNHRAVTPEFKLTRERSAIVKLHGDYLYDNLQNTDRETQSLSDGMEDALQRTVNEYGLVVVGYSGTDESIMGSLLEADPEYGIFWCARDPEGLSGATEDLLQKNNTYLVEIDGFVDLMKAFNQRINEVEIPTRRELVERAQKRADQIQETLDKYGESDDDNKKDFVREQKFKTAYKAHADGDYQRAKELWDEVIDLDPSDSKAYTNRGMTRQALGEYEAAIEDYDQAMSYDQPAVLPLLNRAETRIQTGDYQNAYQDARKANSRGSSHVELTESLLLQLISMIVLGEDTDTVEQKYRLLCVDDFTTDWNFDPLDSWLESADLESDERERIAELIDLLREHEE